MDRDSKIRSAFRRRFETSPSLTIVWTGVCLFLAIFIAFPLICVLLTPSASDFVQVAQSAIWKKAALNTLYECLCSSFLAVLIGYIYAYAVVRGHIPCARFFSLIPLIHLITPPFVGGLSFILLLGKNGFITSKVLGLDVSLYGFWGLLIAQTLCFFPVAYLMCSQTLSAIDGNLEQAAQSLGAGKVRTFFKLILPLSMPGITSSALFIAVSVMSDFGNPMLVAGRFRVLAVEIYTQLTGWVNGGFSAVLGLFLVIPSVILFILQNRMARRDMERTATIGGRSSEAEASKPHPATRVLLTLFCLFITACVLAQFASIIAGSFQKIWGVNTAFTWNHIKNLAKCTKEIRNSLTFALEGALLSTLVALVASYLVYRTNCPLKKTIDTLSQLPAAVPGTLFGLAFTLASTKVGYHNSAVLIVIAIAVGFMPFSYRILSSAFSQIKPSIDEGARSLGASRVKVLYAVLVPIVGNGISNSIIFDFIRGVGTMSAVIFLVSFGTPLASIKILNLAEQGFWGDAAALALLLTFITFAAVCVWKLVQYLIGRSRKDP